ncbi:hypothetical protein SAMN04488527_11061 [Aliiroseovarius crassostreae]|uniref:Uncharacterized protein n=1 Tax=Aliiroseovarius crassostreae TaxID=154981 RepID=A0A0P7KHP5_9RHOB|nr:hypothetical protein [Aliiroseovarius crassostreae]KPN63034.1 hypothetical protein AKJ29_02480 [Aliiroseovarius crassostreae]SFU67543.1 hypothetical protein SAMN04488527_11061 [Aliiroseovarius crassostreae]
MPINADGYFNHLKTFLDTRESVGKSNIPHYGQLCRAKEREGLEANEFVLADTDETTKERLKAKLTFSGRVLGLRLDACKNPLFHFLDDDGKRPWMRKCDFVLFQAHANRLKAYCIEFKKARTFIPASDVMLQLHKLIAAYSNKDAQLEVSKYVFTDCQNPGPDLDPEGKYLKDYPDIRHYLFSDVDGMALEDLENDTQKVIV